jgi:hypothetical protein
LSLCLPLARDHARFLHYVGAPRRYESQDLPRNSYSKALPEGPGPVFASGFKTTVWIGDNRRGLLWCAESDQYWWPEDRDDAIRIGRRPDGTAELVLRLIAARPPVSANHLEYRFALMATPVRPMPEGWRSWTFSAQYDSLTGEKRGNHLVYWPDQWRFLTLDPDPYRARNLKQNRERNARDHREGRVIMPYWTRLHLPVRDGEKVLPDAEHMSRPWLTEPNRPGGGSLRLVRCSATTAWADYLVWCTHEWAKVMGRMDGVYIDETQPVPNTRAESGGGYDGWSGKRRPTFEFRGSRAMYQRMMYLIRKRNGVPACSIAHCSATHTMQCLSPFPAMLIGEQYYSGYFTHNPERLPPEDDRVYYYSYALPMDRLRAECFWGQWGAVMVWLPCLKNQKDILDNPLTTRDMLSRVMQADMLVWPLFCNQEEIYTTWRFRREFGIGDPGVRFVPYWENTRLPSDRDGVVVGYYRKGRRVLALVSNLNRQPETVTIDLRALRVRTAIDAETGTAIPVEAGRLELALRRNDYRALVLSLE